MPDTNRHNTAYGLNRGDTPLMVRLCRMIGISQPDPGQEMLDFASIWGGYELNAAIQALAKTDVFKTDEHARNFLQLLIDKPPQEVMIRGVGKHGFLCLGTSSTIQRGSRSWEEDNG